jgi:hypothetical protein
VVDQTLGAPTTGTSKSAPASLVSDSPRSLTPRMILAALSLGTLVALAVLGLLLLRAARSTKAEHFA